MTEIGVIAHTQKTLGGGLSELRRLLAKGGHHDVPWAEISKSRLAPQHVREMVHAGVERIIVWGGDGTVRRCIHTLVDEKMADVSLGVLPAGTANLLATNLLIPTDLESALQIAVCGEARLLDVGEMNGKCFAVMGGTGFDALMIKDADEHRLKERFGRLGYVGATLRNSSARPARVSIEIDGRPWFTGDASCVLTANVGTILGGIEPFPDASPTDGRLEVGVVQARTRRDWARVAARAVTGSVEFSPFVTTTSCRDMEIVLDKPWPWEIDGGAKPKTKKYSVRCLPDAVRICQPEVVT
jgi:YegS/Rv2252/BmrU family lipid kinase